MTMTFVAPPANVRASWTPIAGQMLVEWTASTDARANAYVVNGSTDNGSTWHQIGRIVEGRNTTHVVVVGLDDSLDWLVAVRSTQGGARSLSAECDARPAPTPPPPPPPPVSGVVWAADGTIGGPTNDPFKEWASVVAAGVSYPKHPNINIVKQATTPAGVVLPGFGHEWMYEMKLPAYTGTSTQVYGDRTEGIMETVGSLPYTDHGECAAPPEARWWEAGDHIWLAFGYCAAHINPEHGRSLDPTGVIPLWQLHEPGGATAHVFAKIRGTKPGGSYPAPRSTAEWNGGDLWQETQGLIIGPTAWYAYVTEIVMGTNGKVAVWSMRPGETTLTKRGEQSGNTMGSASKLFPCMGGPRNEEVGGCEAVEQTWYTCGWNQADSREAATARAFGKVL